MTTETSETPEQSAESSALAAIRADPARRRHATAVAQYAVERLSNIHGTRFGEPLVRQFTDYVLEQATDIDAGVLAKHATNLAFVKLADPDAWAGRKQWLAVPKGHRLLKALMRVVREADKAAEELKGGGA